MKLRAGKLARRVKGGLGFLFSKRGIPTWKGVIAYVLAYVLIFLRGFEHLSTFPLVLTGVILITIAGQPGKSIGACIQSSLLAIAGVLVGAFNFFILAKLGDVTVAQAIVFALMIYLLALVKAASLKYLAFCLLAILMTFSGIYTSLLEGGVFVPGYLKSYVEAYLWGVGIVLFVNLCIFPHSSESEMRKMLVVSLDHIRTFMHLINKGYLMELSDDERAVRAQLVQSLRADFGFLNQMMSETFVEINWSRWSMQDYRQLVLKVRSVQATLIAAYSGLLNGEENHSVETFKERFLPKSVDSFRRLRKDICLTIGEIMQELSTEPLDLKRPGYAEFKEHDLEKQEDPAAQSRISAEGEVDQEEILEEVGRRLREEAADADNGSVSSGTVVQAATPAVSDLPTPHGPTVIAEILVPGDRSDEDGDPEKDDRPTGPVKNLRIDFDAFSTVQLDLIGQFLVSGGLLADSQHLHVSEPMASVAETWGQDLLRGVRESQKTPNKRDPFGPGPHGMSPDDDEEDQDALVTGHGLVRVYSLLFAMNRFITELQALHSHVTQTSKGALRHKHLHVHMWESLSRPPKASPGDKEASEMCIKEAIAELEAKEYVPVKTTLVQKAIAAEQWLRSPTSIYAFKVTLALCVYGVLIWAPLVRSWFISYGMTGALITIVITLTPTLGQSLVSFIFQILGSALGYITGLIVLEIFKDVGGYRFNPYGITCLMGLYAIPLAYAVHEKPQYFVLGLLAMNSAGVLIVTEYVYNVVEGVTTFDSPPYRAGKALAALSISLCLVLLFQLLILRNPARRTLRKSLAKLVEAHLAYVTILQAYCRSLMPIDPKDYPSQASVLRVERELKRREAKLQAHIISLSPLIAFANAEPQWDTPFHPDAAQKIIRANQILLDRWSEARSAVGSVPFQPFISREFVAVLSPYRRHSFLLVKTSLYLAAASLASKMALPAEIPKAGRLTSDLTHDALILSARFANSPEGQESVKSGEFSRYWFYLLVMTSACRQIMAIEEGCRIMYSSFEDQIF